MNQFCEFNVYAIGTSDELKELSNLFYGDDHYRKTDKYYKENALLNMLIQKEDLKEWPKEKHFSNVTFWEELSFSPLHEVNKEGKNLYELIGEGNCKHSLFDSVMFYGAYKHQSDMYAEGIYMGENMEDFAYRHPNIAISLISSPMFFTNVKNIGISERLIVKNELVTYEKKSLVEIEFSRQLDFQTLQKDYPDFELPPVSIMEGDYLYPEIPEWLDLNDEGTSFIYDHNISVSDVLA